MAAPTVDSRPNPERAVLAVLPFLALGVGDLALLPGGLRPLWAFLILPPVVSVSVLGYVAFRSGFARERP